MGKCGRNIPSKNRNEWESNRICTLSELKQDIYMMFPGNIDKNDLIKSSLTQKRHIKSNNTVIDKYVPRGMTTVALHFRAPSHGSRQ
jgi:hypothetical protein